MIKNEEAVEGVCQNCEGRGWVLGGESNDNGLR